MGYDIDDDYPFETTESGWSVFPEGMTKDGNLYVLPNGRYLPQGAYMMKDGSTIIYEPRELSPFADLLAKCTEP